MDAGGNWLVLGSALSPSVLWLTVSRLTFKTVVVAFRWICFDTIHFSAHGSIDSFYMVDVNDIFEKYQSVLVKCRKDLSESFRTVQSSRTLSVVARNCLRSIVHQMFVFGSSAYHLGVISGIVFSRAQTLRFLWHL